MKRAVVFANGDLPDNTPLTDHLRLDDLIIAANGGSRHCRALGLTPYAIVGDLDSLLLTERSAWVSAGVRFEVASPRKDETDLELALRYAAQLEVTHILIVGAGGGRLDMTLANLLLLTHPDLAGIHVELWHANQAAWLIRPPGGDVSGRKGDTLSLIPLAGPAEGITTEGLAYALQDESLAFGLARGVSNELTHSRAHVHLRAGTLLAIRTTGRA